MVNRKIVIAIAIPILILLAMTVPPLMSLTLGQTVYLETESLDPIDLYRGQHIILNYKISEVIEPPNASKIEQAYNKKHWLPVYGILEKKGQYYEIKDLSLQKPEGLYLKGKLLYVNTYENYEDKKRAFSIDYNLDKYFIPEGTGTSLEEASLHGNLVAEIKIYKGYGQLIRVEAK